MDTSYIPTEAQLLVTIGLFVFSWTLNRTIPGGGFFRWWTWGWLAFTLALLVFRVTFVSPGTHPRALEFLGSQGSFLQVAFFALGANELGRGRGPSRRMVALALVSASALAFTIDANLPPLAQDAILSMSVRASSRGLGLAVVFALCGILLVRKRSPARDAGTLVTAVFFLLYGLNQAVYGTTGLWEFLAGTGDPGSFFVSWYLSPWAFGWDILMETGIGVGCYLMLTAEYRRTHGALQASEARFRGAFSSAPTGMALLGPDGTILRANEALGRLLGRGRDGLVDRRLTEFVHPDDRASLSIVGGGASPPGEQRGPTRLRAKDGTVRETIIDAASIGTGTAGTEQRIVQVLDVTELMRLERELLQIRKREATGRMAAALAHNFNNLLTVILGNTELVLEDVDPSSPLHQPLDDVRRSSLRAVEITRQMLAYLGQLGAARHAVDVDALIQSHQDSLRGALPAGVEMRLCLGGTPPVSADPDLVANALDVLVRNAGEAIGDRGGVVELATGWDPEPPAAPLISYLPQVDPGKGFVRVAVTDNGAGISPEVEERIFDPFFSTRFIGRGLGLPSLQGFLRNHDAAVCLDSAPGEGTTFTLFFLATKTASG